MNQSNRKKNIDWLDLLKAVAVTLIVFHHYQQSFGVTFPGLNFYGGKFYFGNLVEFFFLVSGFVALYSFKGCQEGVRGGLRPI